MNALHTFAPDDGSQSMPELGKQIPAGEAQHAETTTATKYNSESAMRALDALAQCMADSALGG